MLFNSIDFAIFLPIVFVLYWFVTNNNLKLQNLLIVVASYLFYIWWDWRFSFLLLFSTVVDYTVGLKLKSEENNTRRKLYLWSSIMVNIGSLGFFKYYNFFIDNFVAAFSLFGTKINGSSLNIILPVGISFYTFQTLSYSIDVYKKKIEPTKDFIAFSAFVSFFPQLVAGPIERATNLLPQILKKRSFIYSNATDGMRQILWGLFKKMVIADNCAVFANLIFNKSSDFSGSTLLLGAIFFTFQIYCDFSGYTDIAIGSSRLLGFDLKQNFNFPYFSRDIAEFWRRWHISLSSWFKDYLYIPLGGSRGRTGLKVRNVFIIFIVSGLWHGANWTFIAWGAFNALFFIPLLLTNNNRTNIETIAQGKFFPTIKEFFSILLTFSITVFAWIIFRSNSIDHAINYISEIISISLFTVPKYANIERSFIILFIIALFILIEWQGRNNQYAIAHFGKSWYRPVRWSFYSFLLLLIGMFMPSVTSPFIYFKF